MGVLTIFLQIRQECACVSSLKQGMEVATAVLQSFLSSGMLEEVVVLVLVRTDINPSVVTQFSPFTILLC